MEVNKEILSSTKNELVCIKQEKRDYLELEIHHTSFKEGINIFNENVEDFDEQPVPRISSALIENIHTIKQENDLNSDFMYEYNVQDKGECNYLDEKYQRDENKWKYLSSKYRRPIKVRGCNLRSLLLEYVVG
ncbi:uncharacterized protein LOC130895294 isoform X2 [Diorhabda carinulata]|uniref:uncharacterized protein LOC130895294 isoform X2 n=1 Tax=Diorhabda carinulata TaxID=1163345 RepID=UPI0025A1D773|nr:uncharacterized protein LOC130895294 isoform X2 [Diorhabda carinulata]